MPPQSSAVPGWNFLGRLATDTPADKRRRLSQRLELFDEVTVLIFLPTVVNIDVIYVIIWLYWSFVAENHFSSVAIK